MKGHIDVDLDGTLAEYHGWNNGEIGEPIPLMAMRIRRWQKQKIPIRILTARAATSNKDRETQIKKISDWCFKYFGERFLVTAEKDSGTMEIWDDRAIQIIKNTGKRADGIKD